MWQTKIINFQKGVGKLCQIRFLIGSFYNHFSKQCTSFLKQCKKFISEFSLFDLISFDNGACHAKNNFRNGTCHSIIDCDSKGRSRKNNVAKDKSLLPK